MGHYFLGVDGGQSSTTALIGDEKGRVIGAGSAGPCNHVGAAEGRAKLTRTMRECLERAGAQAGLNTDEVHFRAACFGMSGGPADKQQLLPELIQADIVVVTHDGRIALSGAMAGEPGVITIAGTGSFAFGRSGKGVEARAGGWGYIFGDEGSAFDLVRKSVRAALRFEEGWGPPTLLRASLIQAFDAVDANDVLHRLYTSEWPRSRAATLAQMVDQAANAGDSAAQAILRDGAEQLAALAKAIAGQLWQAGEHVNVAFIGGVFRSRILRERYRAIIEGEGWGCGPPLLDPAAGALLEAYRAASFRVILSGVPDLKS